jgi:beta-mannosidase
MEREIWQDTVAGCGDDGTCYVRSDSLSAVVDASVDISVIDFSTGESTRVAHVTGVNLGVGAGQVHRFCLGAGSVSSGTCESLKSAVAKVGMSSCWSPDGTVGCALELVADDTILFVLLSPPSLLRLPAANVSITIAPMPPARSQSTIGESGASNRLHSTTATTRSGNGIKRAGAVATVTLESSDTALYVTLTTEAQGRFSDNAIFLRPHERREVEFVQFDESPPDQTLTVLRATTRVMHLELSMRDASVQL